MIVRPRFATSVGRDPGSPAGQAGHSAGDQSDGTRSVGYARLKVLGQVQLRDGLRDRAGAVDRVFSDLDHAVQRTFLVWQSHRGSGQFASRAARPIAPTSSFLVIVARFSIPMLAAS